MNSFVALDVETANSNYASICAIGAARYEDGLVADEWYELIDPRADFLWRNIEIHGIRERDVQGRTTFAQVSPELTEFVDGDVVVHHSHFDRNAIGQASERWQLAPPEWEFIDSLSAAKRAWPERHRDGYQLPDLMPGARSRT